MKIAYLLSVYKDPIHLNRLILALNNKNVDFYIYIDKKSKTKFTLPNLRNIHILKNADVIHWGGFSQVKSTLDLMTAAHDSQRYDYYVLLSGSDYPLRSNKKFFNYLQDNYGKEFIEMDKMPLNDKSFDRVEYFFLEGSKYKFLSYFYFKINTLTRTLGIKRKYPIEYSHLVLYGGSHWWILSNDCIEYILTFVANNSKFVNYYKYTYIPIEMFFHTIIGNSKFIKNVKSALTYTDWDTKKRPLPAEITEEHLPILTQPPSQNKNGKAYFFARKFFDKSTKVTDIIEKKLRK